LLAGAAVAVMVAFGVLVSRRVGGIVVPAFVWQGGLALAGLILVWLLLERSDIRDHALERRVLDARASDLTMRAIAPGSALACLDAGAGATVEAACEKALFGTPEGVAAAVAYVDARISQLATSVPLAERDPAYQPVVERLRRALEADRYGLVAQVLVTRGCKSTDCQDLKLVRDNSRIMANMRANTFDSLIRVHAVAWAPGSAPVNTLAAAPSSPGAAPAADAQPSGGTQQPAALPTTAATVPGAVPEVPPSSSAPTHAPVSSKYDFPSAASIPAVSIMTPEPAPPAAEAKAAPAPSPPPARRTAPSQPSRNQSSRETAPRPSAPQQIVPQPQPNPQTPATR
jgi:hypothetical protein